MALLAAADGGLRGVVVDEHDKPVDRAVVRIEELNVELETRERGERQRGERNRERKENQNFLRSYIIPP